MYKIFKGFNCRTVKGTNLEIRSGAILKSYVLNHSRSSITLNLPDMTVEVEDDFDIKEYIIPMAEEDTKDCSSFEQQKDRTYRHGVTKNYDFVDNLDNVVEDGKDKTNQELKEATLTVIEYLKSIDCTNLEQTIVSFLGREEKRLQKEYDRLNILTASDDEIIQNALLYYANDYLAHYGTETANKIRDVRDRYLDRKDKE